MSAEDSRNIKRLASSNIKDTGKPEYLY
ncbi:uncharacterized protein G2W53_043481 [Senna tora]|uniref:Uncharacterized protein n=1 Tax=Senna tora TaxID=362788 RepID=A0A834SH39_9FABA|nr:uncharacterized protein G2W53_043481 [Senna tora]